MDYIEKKLTYQYSNKNKLNQFMDQKTQLILEKIKLDERPEYKQFLQSYFNEPSKYFLKNFKNKPVIIGKKYNKKNTFKIKFQVKSSPKRQKKIKNLNEQKNKSSLEQSSIDLNKGNNAPKENINNLKAGQRYVDDLELNEIFSNFKSTQRANKSKITNNLTINDIKKFRAENLENSKSIKGRLLMRKKTIKLLKGYAGDMNNYNNKMCLTENNTNNNSNNNSIGKVNSKKSVDSLKRKESNDSFPHLNSNKNINILLKNYQNNNNFIFKERKSTISNDSLSNNSYLAKDNNNKLQNNFNKTVSHKISNNPYNFSKLYSTFNENNEIDIFKKQTQYLTTEKYKIFRKELGDRLVSQENTFLNNLNLKNRARQMSLYMSNKLKRPKEKLLMNRTEYFRIQSDLKTRLSKELEYEYIDEFYEWEKNLKNFETKIKYEETITDPGYKINNYPKKRFYSFNNEYLTKRLPKKNLKKFINNIDKINNNLRGLFIEGKNLLELEQELAKGIKGKKILNNYEEILPYSSLKDDIYAKHFKL